MTHELTEKIWNANPSLGIPTKGSIEKSVREWLEYARSKIYAHPKNKAPHKYISDCLGLEPFAFPDIGEIESGQYVPTATGPRMPFRAIGGILNSEKKAKMEHCQHINYIQNIFGPIGVPSKIKYFDCPWCVNPAPRPAEKLKLWELLLRNGRAYAKNHGYQVETEHEDTTPFMKHLAAIALDAVLEIVSNCREVPGSGGIGIFKNELEKSLESLRGAE